MTTNCVLVETLTGIRRRGGPGVAVSFGEAVYGGVLPGLIRYERIDPGRETQAFLLFTRFRDLPGLSFTDCTSFVVMRALGIRDAFTGDADFERVGLGFRRLLT